MEIVASRMRVRSTKYIALKTRLVPHHRTTHRLDVMEQKSFTSLGSSGQIRLTSIVYEILTNLRVPLTLAQFSEQEEHL